MAGPDLLLQAALSRHQSGRLAEAESLYRQVLVASPSDPDALHMLGVIALQSNRPQVAAELIGQSIGARPNFAPAHFNLGRVLKTLGRLDASIAAYQAALALDPTYAEVHDALGSTLAAAGRFTEAIDSFRRAIQYQPNFAGFHSNLGSALHQQGMTEEAIAEYRRAIELDRRFSHAHLNLGIALAESAAVAQAIKCFEQVLSLNPADAKGHYNLGNALLHLHEPGRALVHFQRAIQLAPRDAQNFSGLANAYKDLGYLDDAVVLFRRAVELKSADSALYSNLLFSLQYHPRLDAVAILREHQAWNQSNAAPMAATIRPHANDRSPGRRLRVGYVSPDFREHCQSLFTVPLLSQHDHEQFEIHCYSSVRNPDAITHRLQGYADAWRPVARLSDADLAHKISDDQIDILVDLTMHMAGGRPLLFARKPSPIQICWLAYPGTTGLSTLDYRLTDPHLDPPGRHDHFYSEKSLRLPDTFWCYDPLTTTPPVNELPAETSGHITFGSLNNFCKVNDDVLSLWARLLAAVPDSRLLLLTPRGADTDRLLRQLDVAPQRVEFLAPRPRLDYLALYHRIDISLDTFPYNGHTTSLDSLWMAVPVVTLVGPTVVGRAGLSQLTNLCLQDLIAYAPSQYLQIAADLAGDLPRLSGLRRTLRQRMQASALMDAKRFARAMESLYREAWKRWLAER